MMSAGQLLQSERLKRNRSLAEISSDTCISTRYLEAIERDDIKQLPGDFFYKAFLRQYAKSLDLDSATTDHIVAAAVPGEEIDPVPVMSNVYQKANEPTSSRWTPSTAVAVGSLVLVLAGGAGLYSWFQRLQMQREAAASEAQTPQNRPDATPPPAAATPAQGQTAAAQPQQQPTPGGDPGSQQQQQQQQDQQQVAASTPAPLPTPTPAAPAPTLGTGNIALEIVASEPTWVQISSGGKTVYIGTLQPDQARQFAVTENARLLTGNAGALDVRMNGRSVGSLGPKGQVRTVYFSNDSFQIAPPKPRPTTTGEALTGTANTAYVSIRPTRVDH